MVFRYQLLLLMVSVVSASCKTTNNSNLEATQAQTNQIKAPRPSVPSVCSAVRGNGHYIFAHFPALARTVENFGIINGGAGGSSGSITQFLYESMYINPAVWNCPSGACTESQTRNRVSYLIKSIFGYADAVGSSREIQAIQLLLPLRDEIVKASVKGGSSIAALLKVSGGDPVKLALIQRELTFVLNKYGKLINPEFAKFVGPDPAKNLQFRLEEGVATIQSFGDFKVDSPKILFSPGVINFAFFPDLMNIIANFYAGYTPIQGRLASHIDRCAAPSNKGKLWEQLDDTCKLEFKKIVETYRKNLDQKISGYIKTKNRMSEKVGAKLPMLISTAMIKSKKAVARVQKGFAAYRNASSTSDFMKAYTAFDSDFFEASVRFSHAGNSSNLRATQNSQAASWRSDLKFKKFEPLFGMSWKEILSVSPAEPGLASIQPISKNGRLAKTVLSAGGWADLSPTNMLKGLGCKKIVFIHSQKSEDVLTFDGAMAKLLGASEKRIDQLYRLGKGHENSSYQKSIEAADAIVCTNWSDIALDNREGENPFTPIVVDSHFASIISDDSDLAKSGATVSSADFLASKAVRGQGGIIKKGCVKLK